MTRDRRVARARLGQTVPRGSVPRSLDDWRRARQAVGDGILTGVDDGSVLLPVQQIIWDDEEIAGALRLRYNTIASYTKGIYRKLAVRSRGEAVFEARQMGLLE